MKIQITTEEDADGHEIQNMLIDGLSRLHVGPLNDCPEDAITCKDVASFMREAYLVGKKGEEFDVEERRR